MCKQASFSSLSVFTKVTLVGFSASLQHKLENAQAWSLMFFVEMAVTATAALEKQWEQLKKQYH